VRRAIVAFVATLAGLVVLLSFKTSPMRADRPVALSGTTPGSSAPDSSAPDSSAPDSSAPASAEPGSSAPTSVGPSSSAPASPLPSVAPTVTPTTAAPTKTAKPTPKPTPTKSATTTKTLTGSAITIGEGFQRFGVVQVRLTVTNGKITKATELQTPQDEPRSSQISEFSIPILREEVLAAQGAKIDVVSGATYTSDAYAQSVQAALDSAKS
jgi:uncharacterized protein with FMN-binding domain